MYTQATPPTLEVLDISREFNIGTPIDPFSDFAELIPPQCRDDIRKLIFMINSQSDSLSAIHKSMLSSLFAFRYLRFLKIQNSYPTPLQDLLEHLHAPSLERLEVAGMVDWRVQWRESFGEAFPNLRGLMIEVHWEEVVEMYDDGEGPAEGELMPPPGIVKWDNILTWYRRSIFLWIEYNDDEIFDPFLENAPQQARRCHLDPIPLIQWYLKSKKMFGRIHFILLNAVSVDDLSTILRAMKLIDCREPLGIRYLNLIFPVDTTASVAHLLPDSVEELSIKLPSLCVLDPSVIPACIRSLPKLLSLSLSLNLSGDTFQPSNQCTSATCSFRSFPGYDLRSVRYSFTPPSNDSQWELELFLAQGLSIHWAQGRRIENDPGDGVVDFEREVRQWFELSPALEDLEISFN